ncbi:MAG: ECF transporter S component [Firmicutes bacterium HGW-Firmicutes-21]|nr:MAG: ECF transporter S component [Firmicutes bacterium HGW-Firmicutes-21]
MKSGTKKLVYAALLLACGVLLPLLFHLFSGSALGPTFLPMHIPVLICGLLLGAMYGSCIGLLAPVLSFLVTGMPTAERLPFMIIELGIYGFASGLLAGRTKHIYPVLISAMVLGRIAYALSLFAAFHLFGMSGAAPAAAWTAVVKGLPGIIIQLVLIPPVVYALRRFILENSNNESDRIT